MDETYPKVGGRRCWLYQGIVYRTIVYRAIDRDGAQVDVPTSEHRDRPRGTSMR